MSGFQFKLVPKGFGAESDRIIKADVEERTKTLDYEVVFNGNVIALVDMSCSNYTFERSGDRTTGYRKLNYNTNKKVWKRGLRGLVAELNRLAGV